MQRIDEYLTYAKQFRKLASEDGPLRAQYRQLADEWERLARARLVEIQKDIDRTTPRTPKPARS